jgi:ADP-heptose:LPS heptosyltransferase
MNAMIPQHILFLAEGQLGDLLLLTPALRAVKESFPSSSIAVLVVERYAQQTRPRPFDDLTASASERERNVLATNPNVDELFVVDRQALRAQHGLARLKAERSVIKFIRERGFDTVVCTFPEDRFVQWAFAAGAKNRIGQRRQPLHWLLTHRLEREKAERGVVEYYCDLVRLLGAHVRSTHTEYLIPETSLVWAEDILRAAGVNSSDRMVVIHPGATGDYKIWPPERYAELLDRLATRGLKPLIVSGELDRDIVNAIGTMAHTGVINVATGGTVGHLAAILQRARLCISNDSGPRHLAIAVGTPSLALFRHHHDKEWDVYEHSVRIGIIKGEQPCPACPAGVCRDVIPPNERFGSYCIRQISVEDVLRRVEQVLAVL